MYKRRARVLFVHPQDPEKAQQAARWAQELGDAWLEARAADGCSPPPWQWPDLVIQLEEPPRPMPLASHTQGRTWRVPAADWPADVQERIRGVIGGFKLLSRLDQSQAPGVQDGREADAPGAGPHPAKQ